MSREADMRQCAYEQGYEKGKQDAVKHGRWIDNGIDGSILCKCSGCGFPCGAYSFRFCPVCGARMDAEGGELE